MQRTARPFARFHALSSRSLARDFRLGASSTYLLHAGTDEPLRGGECLAASGYCVLAGGRNGARLALLVELLIVHASAISPWGYSLAAPPGALRLP